MLKGLYSWVMRMAASRHASWALFAIAFAESSFFPVPPDVMLAPMVITRPQDTWRLAAICTAGSIMGGMLGYAIGYQLEPVGHFILALTGNAGAEAVFRQRFHDYGVWFILGQGLLPVPYKLLTITTGLFHFPIWEFVAASCVTRSARFFGVSALVKRYGPGLLPIIERRLMLTAVVVVALAVVVLIVVKVVTS
ncbi:MAG TPA: YqaA family protein [Caulobacteraceae bacterium]|jgi:membrane protein YqaA with SNARE-associated domain|nr:YqaA family protein [Caulobacteraceae bacterium]